jgi:hypothetical protein
MKKKLLLEATFAIMLIFLALFLQKLDACLYPQSLQCTEGQCFDYEMAFQDCEDWCLGNRGQQCAEAWWIRAACVGSCNNQCNEVFGMNCMDGYTRRGYQIDFCAGCRLN